MSIVSSRSQADQVIADLDGQSQHLGKAQEYAAHAIDLLQRSTQQAIQVGYRGVAERLQYVEKGVTEVHHILDAATGKTRDAVATADQVTDKTVPEDAAQMLAATSATIGAVVQLMLAAQSKTRRCEDEVADALRGAKPGPTLDLLKGLRDQISASGRLAKSAQENCKTTTEGGGQIGSGSGN